MNKKLRSEIEASDKALLLTDKIPSSDPTMSITVTAFTTGVPFDMFSSYRREEFVSLVNVLYNVL